MIRKILTSEYLKPYGKMPTQEREAYRERVGEWLASDGARLLAMTDRPMARAQNLMSMSVRWPKGDCEAVREGVRLMTALADVADTWLPSQLWVKSAWRAIRHIASLLSEVKNEKGKAENRLMQTEAQSVQTAMREAQKRAARELAGRQKKNPSAVESAVSSQRPSPNSLAPVPVRPKHIDQYVHLLPKGTQESAATVKGLLRDLDVARENARRLMEAGEHGSMVAQWANAAARLDEKVGRIYRELDAEWEKLVKTGRIAVDMFGNASAVKDASGEPSGIVAVERTLTSEQKHRRRELRKWLIDLRRGKEGRAREERIGQWRANWKEYLMLEPLELALKDKKVVMAATHFGIDINS